MNLNDSKITLNKMFLEHNFVSWDALWIGLNKENKC